MKILFLCVANSARSQIAEGLAKNILGSQAEIYSAGSEPSGKINPFAIQVMQELDIDITAHHSKSWHDLPSMFLADLDYVITLCAEEVCPVMTSDAHKLHWGMSDPAIAGNTDEERLDAFRSTRETIQSKLLQLKTKLGNLI